MAKHVRIGIIGDYNPSSPTQLATYEALRHAQVALGKAADASWIATPELEARGIERRMESFDGIWAAPGSPYRSMSGALNGIRFARERQWPFFGT